MEETRQTLNDLFKEFKAQMKIDPTTTDRFGLDRGRQIVRQHRQDNTVHDPEFLQATQRISVAA